MPDDRKPIGPIDPDSPEEKPQVSTFDVIQEALRRQAERRKPLGPPKLLETPPTLPRQPKPARDRKKRRGR
jgi:hypothetical protein